MLNFALCQSDFAVFDNLLSFVFFCLEIYFSLLQNRTADWNKNQEEKTTLSGKKLRPNFSDIRWGFLKGETFYNINNWRLNESPNPTHGARRLVLGTVPISSLGLGLKSIAFCRKPISKPSSDTYRIGSHSYPPKVSLKIIGVAWKEKK